MESADPERLRSFIRSTLGCGCPDEILRWIDCTHTEIGEERVTRISRIDVGGQLLVYILDAAMNPRWAISALPAIVAAGLVERDGLGFNRLRIVVAADDPVELQPDAERSFADCAPMDDKLHLHVVAAGDLPFA
jgi:hypothetical protein